MDAPTPTPATLSSDQSEIDRVTRAMLRAFTTSRGEAVGLSVLHRLFIPQALVIKSCGLPLEICNLAEFIAPREKLLNSGSLVDFEEREIHETTRIFGDIAQRFSHYRKSGVLDGTPFEIHGMKSLQFVRTRDGWRISSLIWDDEREGLEIPR